MTSTAVSACGRSMQCSPARGGAARNPGGAWWRVQRRMTTRFLGQVDRWTTKPSRRRVYQEDDLEVRNLRRHGGDFSKLTAACGGAWLGFDLPDFWVFLAGGLGARLWGWF